MRSSPTRSTEDGGSHRGPCGHRQGRVWAGSGEADIGRVSEVRGSLWCTSGFGSSPDSGSTISSSSATSRTGLGAMKQ
jgi:hypothetical protein